MMTTKTGEPKPVCIGCGKEPNQIDEYIEAVTENPSRYADADDYVRREEGTYNPANGHFACTYCYIEMDMPTKPAPDRWIAP